jgi:signal transduction histidine kinase
MIVKFCRSNLIRIKSWAIRLRQPDGRLDVETVEVKDRNGSGFSCCADGIPIESPQPGHYGMREQAELIGADLHVDSQPGHGTRITLHFGR